MLFPTTTRLQLAAIGILLVAIAIAMRLIV